VEECWPLLLFFGNDDVIDGHGAVLERACPRADLTAVLGLEAHDGRICRVDSALGSLHDCGDGVEVFLVESECHDDVSFFGYWVDEIRRPMQT
jgi:hypothetical protein